jgi:hypothetical protein
MRGTMTKRKFKPNIEMAFTIDRENKQVQENGTMATAKIIQTQVAIVRDKYGVVIETEVLHRCKAADGSTFIIDESDITNSDSRYK